MTLLRWIWAAKLVKPGSIHIFGTDEMGRDIFSRLAYGSWYSMGTALAVVLLAAIVGIIVGLESPDMWWLVR